MKIWHFQLHWWYNLEPKILKIQKLFSEKIKPSNRELKKSVEFSVIVHSRASGRNERRTCWGHSLPFHRECIAQMGYKLPLSEDQRRCQLILFSRQGMFLWSNLGFWGYHRENQTNTCIKVYKVWLWNQNSYKLCEMYKFSIKSLIDSIPP